MESIWFGIVCVLLTGYVLLDGFDFGAGLLHLIVAKNEEERGQILQAIGPFWDGNEVWMLSAGAVLVLAFPPVLAAGFSGLYLGLVLVTWCLLLRGISIEFRSHVRGVLWRQFWDRLFAISSALLAILLGVALGNVLRGVPLDSTGYFNLPLFTNFGIQNPVGILDIYTVFTGIFALVVLTAHGALFLAWKTGGAIQERCHRLARPLWIAVLIVCAISTVATRVVTPRVFTGFAASPLAWAFALVYGGGLALVFYALAKGRQLLAFLGSSAFIAGILATTAASVWPVLLPSNLNPAHSLTIFNASSGRHGLQTGLAWMCLAFPLVFSYFIYLFRVHRGKVEPGDGTY